MLPTCALLLAMTLYASSFIALKYAFTVYDPMLVIFGRMLIASCCFLLVGRRLTRRLEYRKGDYKLLLFMALCEPCLYFIFEAKAIENTTASQAGMITAMLPIFVMVAAVFTLKEKITVRSWIGGLLAVAGVIWLTTAGVPSENAPNPVLGNILEIFAMVCATGYTISIRTLTRRYSPFFLTATQVFVGCLFYFPLVFFPTNSWPEQWQLLPGLAIVYLGAFVSLVAYSLNNYGLKHIEANRAASFVNLIPIFSVLLGWLVLGERFSTGQVLAAAVIMTGVLLAQK